MKAARPLWALTTEHGSKHQMQLSLGPIQYYWSKAQVELFYRDIADSDVPLVYLGETVCSKRKELNPADWLALAAELKQAKKQVVLSTLALIEAPQEIEQQLPYLQQQDFWVEANDMGVVQLAREYGIPFVAGSAINCYNLSALKRLLKAGMKRWNMPVELSRDWLAALLTEAEAEGIRDQFEVEVHGHGHLPLAYSARCFTARSENKPKDQCKKCCLNYPSGRAVDNLEGERLFVLNGIQTLSGYCMNLANDVDSMQGLVDWFRVSPQFEGTTELMGRLQKQMSHPKSMALKEHECNGYWHQIEGFAQVNG